MSAILLLVLFIYQSSSRRVKRKGESNVIASLVQATLDALQCKALAHLTDPTRTIHPYIASHQLRDMVLQDEHSVAARQKIWAKIEKIVEGNTNVRANMDEVDSGDELRVWRWVGRVCEDEGGFAKPDSQNPTARWRSPDSLISVMPRGT